MEELKIIYGIITCIWKLFKKYGCHRLDNGQWEGMLNDCQSVARQCKKYGEEFYLLFYDLYSAILKYYKRKEPGYEEKSSSQRQG